MFIISTLTLTLPPVMSWGQIGSALQLSTFSWIKEHVKEWGWVSEVWVPVVASVLSSFNIVVFMEPFDVVRTRIYNQPIDSRGKGALNQRGMDGCQNPFYRYRIGAANGGDDRHKTVLL